MSKFELENVKLEEVEVHISLNLLSDHIGFFSTVVIIKPKITDTLGLLHFRWSARLFGIHR